MTLLFTTHFSDELFVILILIGVCVLLFYALMYIIGFIVFTGAAIVYAVRGKWKVFLDRFENDPTFLNFENGKFNW